VTTRGLGYKPDLLDPRDHHVDRLAISRVALPRAASVKPFVVDVLDQGNTSSCVAHAFAQALRIAHRVDGKESPLYTRDFPLFSREFLYYNARAEDGGEIEDSGTMLRSCSKALVHFGAPVESVWPFNLAHINERPSWRAYRFAYDFRGSHHYARVPNGDLAGIKAALAAKIPVAFGTQVPQSFLDHTGTGVVDLTHEKSVGGHAMCLVGYDGDTFELVNSWGTGWGAGGFARVTAAWIEKASDLWALDT